MEKNKNLIINENGQALILVALIFTVLLGFGALAIDYGYLSLQKRELQNAADAAALAGVVDLSLGKSEAEAYNTVIKYVKENTNAFEDIVATEFENYITTDLNNTNNQLAVTINKDYELFFAKAIGVDSSTVSASATATWVKTVTGGNENGSGDNQFPVAPEELKTKMLPIAVLESDLNLWLSTPNLSIENFNNLGIIARKDFAGLGNRYHGFFGYYNSKDKAKYYDDDVIEEWFEGKKVDDDDLDSNLTHNGFFKSCTNQILPLANNRGDRDDYLEDAADEIEERTEDKTSFSAVIPVVERIENTEDAKIKYFIKVLFIDILANNGNLRGENYKDLEEVFEDVEFISKKGYKDAFVVSFFPDEKYSNVFDCDNYPQTPGDDSNESGESKIIYKLVK